MNAKQFAIAVAPIVVADIALDLTHQYFANRVDIAWRVGFGHHPIFSLPFWAGARVVRRGGPWQLSCLGGISVFLGTILLIVITEFIEPAEFEFPLGLVLTALLVLFPIYALLGFLGGKVAAHRMAIGA